MKIECVQGAFSLLGEGPIYLETKNTICWVDILGNCWSELDLDSRDLSVHSYPETISAILPRLGGGYIGATKSGFAELDSHGQIQISHRFLAENERMNDAKCDPIGRIWAGSTDVNFKSSHGKLYRLNLDLSYEVVLKGLTLPNGLGWSPDDSTFYLIDSYEETLWSFDFNPTSGEIRNKRKMIDFHDMAGIPDGLSVASDGTLFVAMWDGASIVEISDNGKIIDIIKLPISRPTSCCFTGKSNEDLIITTASVGIGNNHEPHSGKLFRIPSIGKQGLKQSSFQESLI
jgi:sugar lactone lactonase YvrE